jgi:hypothetical protein
MRDRLGRPRHPITPITSTQNGPLRLAPGIRRGRSFPGSTTRWSAGGALTSPPVTTSFLLSSAATLPPRSTRRHPRARPPIVSSISRRMTRRASAPAVASSGGGAEVEQKSDNAGAAPERRRGSPYAVEQMCRSGPRIDNDASLPAAARSSMGACSGHGHNRRSGGERRARQCTDQPRPVGTRSDLKVGPAATSRRGPATAQEQGHKCSSRGGGGGEKG